MADTPRVEIQERPLQQQSQESEPALGVPLPFSGPTLGGGTRRNSVSLDVINDQRAFVALLEAILNRSGHTTTSLAEALGVKRQSVQQYFHERRRPSIKQFVTFVEACGGRLSIEFPPRR